VELIREKANKKNNKLITSKNILLMKEKTRVLVAVAAVFAAAMIIVAFGSFIENQKKMDFAQEISGKNIRQSTGMPEKIQLEKTLQKEPETKKIRQNNNILLSVSVLYP